VPTWTFCEHVNSGDRPAFLFSFSDAPGDEGLEPLPWPRTRGPRPGVAVARLASAGNGDVANCFGSAKCRTAMETEYTASKIGAFEPKASSVPLGLDRFCPDRTLLPAPGLYGDSAMAEVVASRACSPTFGARPLRAH